MTLHVRVVRPPERMPIDERRAATVADPDGHEVVLLVRIWEQKIARDHPELVDCLDAVMETSPSPTTSSRTRFPPERGSTGATSAQAAWLMAVVSYEQQPARIITALANRKDPRRWKP